MRPIVKWAGGKRRLLKHILPLVPRDIGIYCEPFVGGGAVWLSVAPSKALISDANEELMLTYRVIRDRPDELLKALSECRNEETFYYSIRDWDRIPLYDQLHSSVDIAARFLYLNRTCYNGLYRVNQDGQFNVPYGKYVGVDLVQEDSVRELSRYLNETNVILDWGDYWDSLKLLKEGDFAYLDPPYDPVSETANFTGYTSGGFGRDAHQRLKDCCDALNRKGVRFLLSNSCTGFIQGLYSNYICERVEAERSIGADSTSRKRVTELLIRNYEI